MDEKQALVPRLRFPEFREAGEWQERPLCNFVESLDAGVSVNSGDRPAAIDEKGILKTSAVTDGVFNPMENKVVADSGEIQRLKEPVTKNTIIISRMNTPTLVGANAYIKEDCENLFLPDRLWAAKPKHNTSMQFIAYILGSVKGHAALSELATGTSGSMKNIAKVNVLELPVVTPGLEEQQKIADCLSSLDTLITAQADKIDALKAHKQGLMQQLFPREGETVPRLRFPKFREAGKWHKTQLGKLGEFTGGGTPSKSNDSFWKGSIPWVSSSDISENSIHEIRVSRFITEEALKNSAAKLVPEGSILLVSRVGVGKLAITKSAVCTSQDFTNFTPYSDDPEFLGYMLKANSRGLEALGQGMAIKGFTKEDISKFTVFVPELEEQQRIAGCLSSLDTLIAAQTEKFDALKVHKKGLMQQLFPSAETVGA